MFQKKMLRDILSNKGSYLSCLILIVMGLAFFMAFNIAVENLRLGKETLYREQNFAEGFAEVDSLLKRDLENLRNIEGVRQVSGRLVEEVRVHNLGMDESVYLELISQNLSDPERLNSYVVEKGEELAKGERVTLLDTYFMEAHQLKEGDSLEIIHGGQLEEITVNGIAMSPEIVYLLRSQAQIYPSPEQFGAALIPLDTLWEIFPQWDRRVNNLVFTLDPGADYYRVEERMEKELEPYGLKTIYPREDHVSHFTLNEQMEIMGLFAYFVPVLLLTVAGFVIFILLKRIIEQQRSQIGILKAIGYSQGEVLFHYLSFSLVLAVAGGLLGGFLGMLGANQLSDIMMEEFFLLPREYIGFSPSYLALGLILCLVVMTAAGYLGSRGALKLQPAEAMRPPAPPRGNRNILERISFFTSLLTVQGKMGVRNLGRKPGRSAFMFFAIAASCAIVIFTWALAYEIMPTFMFHHYDRVEVYDAKITFLSPLSRGPVQREVEGHPQVSWAEPLAEIPVKLTHHWQEEEVELLGVTRGSRLYNILDAQGNPLKPPREGLILNHRLADNLGLGVGDRVKVESDMFYQEFYLEVVKTIPQVLGMNAYMELSALEGAARQSPLATSLLVEGQEGQEVLRELHESFGESHKLAGIDGWVSMRESLKEYWETMGFIVRSLPLIGLVFSFAVIYVSSFIVLSERNRELASMRVLGMTSREVLSVITFEQWFLAFFALLTGIPLARLLLEGFAREAATDMYSLPVEMSLQTMLIGTLFTAFSIGIAQAFALQKIRGLDLVEVLKSRE